MEDKVEELVRELIGNKAYVDFLVGRDGDFDQIVSSTVLRVKKRVFDANSSLIWVMPYETAEYRDNVESFEEYYDEVELCQESASAHFKGAIQIRNRYMVDRADLLICYVEKESGENKVSFIGILLSCYSLLPRTTSRLFYFAQSRRQCNGQAVLH